MAMNHAEEVPSLLREALDHARLALRRASGIRSYREMLTHALATLTEAELRLGHTRLAADLVRERAQLWPDDAEEQFRVAHDLAATAAKIGGGKADLTGEQRSERDADHKDILAALRARRRAASGMSPVCTGIRSSTRCVRRTASANSSASWRNKRQPQRATARQTRKGASTNTFGLEVISKPASGGRQPPDVCSIRGLTPPARRFGNGFLAPSGAGQGQTSMPSSVRSSGCSLAPKRSRARRSTKS